MRKSMRCDAQLSGPTSAFESAPPKWPGNSCHATCAIFSTNARSRFSTTSSRRLESSPGQCRNVRGGRKILFSDTGHKLALWHVKRKETSAQETENGSTPTSLLRPDRGEWEPVKGVAPAFHRPACAQPTAGQARRRGRQAVAQPFVQRRL